MSNKEKLLASAQKNLQKGLIAKAIKDYQQIVELDPKDIRNRQKLAELLCRAGMNTEALGEYGAVAAYYGDNGFYLKAIAVYKQMQKLDPELVDVYHRLAELNVKQSLIGNALAEYRNLLTLFERKKLFSEAIAVLQKIAELEPDNLNIHVKIAEYCVQSGLGEKAREELAQVLEQLHKTQDFSRIARLYELFLPLFPGDREIKGGYADALVRKGDSEKGLQILKELLQASPESRPLLGSLARAYRASEDFENERLTYQHLLKQTPGDLELREAFIRACLDGGDYERTLAELGEWTEAFCAAGLSAVPKLFYEELQEFLPDNEKMQHGLALVCEQTGHDSTLNDATADVSPLAASDPAETEEFLAARVTEPLPPTAGESSAATDVPPLSAEPLDSIEPSEAATEAEEIPLEFLESAVTPRMALSSEQLSAPLSTSPVPLPEANALATPTETLAEEPADRFTEEMEFELELVLDDFSSETTPGFEIFASAAADDVAGEVGADFPALDSESALEELEDFVELDAIEDVDEVEELTIVDLPEEPEVEPAAAARPDGSPPVESFAGGLTAVELGDLLSGLEHVAGSAPNLRDELDEAEFYLQQGLLDDAERVCRQILEIDTECSAAREKLSKVAARRRASAVADQPFESELLPAAADNAATAPMADDWNALAAETRIGHDEGFDAFRIGVETPVDIEDAETHYNLGIAYKEMGLLDEAVSEFDKALQNPERMVDSLVLKGSCLFMRDDFEQAEKVFKSGLACSQLNADQRLSLNYEMGLLYEAWGRPLEALDSFQAVADVDLFFRNVGDKIEDLRKNLGLDDNAGKEETDSGSRRGRVSYI